MSGICAAVAKQPIGQKIYDALLLLQHRGQDAAGIVTGEGQKFYTHKSKGMVMDVFRTRDMRRLLGNYGIGHVSYTATKQAETEDDTPPFYVNAPFGIVLAHNGRLTNADALKEQLFELDHRHINTNSDTEVLLNVFAHELENATRNKKLSPVEVFSAIKGTMKRIKGAYAVVGMIAGFGVFAFRDPDGIRPLCYGKDAQSDYMVASESVALEANGYELIADVAPAQGLCIELNGTLHKEICSATFTLTPCLFEYVYIARPDSVLDGISIYQSRLKMGEILAKRIISTISPHEIDVVIPVPDSSRPCAIQVAHCLGKPYRDGIVKNRYVGRTFIMPGQAKRQRSVRQKLNAMKHEFAGRNVLLVDDSIVRGTTSREIVQMARDAGAKKVFLASAAPPVRYPNIYGIDMPSKEELIATGRTIDEICQSIGCDELIFQNLEPLLEVVAALNPEIKQFDASCFDGIYIADET